MHITSDNFSIYAAVAFSALSAVSYAIAGLRSVQTLGRVIGWARFCCYAAAASFTYAALYLLSQILSGARNDLSYVFRHTAPTDPLLYRFSSLWAGQEGSMLVWVAMCAWAAVVIMNRIRSRLPLAGAFWMSVVMVLGWVLVVSDPFARMSDYRPGMVGSGLNPLLRNPWVAIHPPVVFLGYAALMVPAAFAVDAMLRRQYDRWAAAAMPWVVSGWVLLGAGIAMGMVWSYEVLGWGGYWGWDPVENASLVPWLLSAALIHGLIVQRRTNRLLLANRVLALTTFLSIIYAVYLTRSGVLSELSVHSFGDGGAYGCWKGLMAGATAMVLGLIALRLFDRSGPQRRKAATSDKLVALGVIGLVLFAAAVLVATSLPLLLKHVVIRPEFYNKMAVPIAVLIVVLTAASALTRRKLSLASNMAHAGVVVMIIGVMFSSGSTSTSISLDKGGPSAVAQGYAFSYQGRRPGGPGIEIAEFRAERGGRTFAAPIVMEYTEHQAVRRPYVREGLLSDLYVSPVEIGDRTVTPTASVTDGGWISLPAVVPGTKATLTLLGMQVEQDMAKLRYQPEHGPPVDVEATKGRPVTAAGITFEVRRLLVSSAKDMSSITAGADVALSGGGVAEAAVIQVSVKPLVSLVWLGLILITLGGVLAAARRIRDGSLRSESDSGSA